jgi:hypothetical protein
MDEWIKEGWITDGWRSNNLTDWSRNKHPHASIEAEAPAEKRVDRTHTCGVAWRVPVARSGKWL